MSRRPRPLLIAAVLAAAVLAPPAGAGSVRTCDGKVATIVGDPDGDGVITGTPSADVIVGTPGADRIEAGGGGDTICALGGADEVFAGWGNDYVAAGKGDDLISGGAGRDLIFGGEGNDTVRAGSGDDQVLGWVGNDVLEGGSGDDLIDGQTGEDVVRGEEGNDRLYGRGGDDVVEGGDHTDRIWAGLGINLIDGGPGYDVCGGGGAKDACEARHHTWTVEEWRDLVAEYFDPLGQTENALSVMDCESQGNPFSVNPSSDASGLFQFLHGTWDWMAGVEPTTPLFAEGRFDPELNVLNASKLVDWSLHAGHSAWSQWSCKPGDGDAPSE